jgi:hypothetical protein
MGREERIDKLISGVNANLRRAPRGQLLKAFEILEARGALQWNEKKEAFFAGPTALKSWRELRGRFENRVLYGVLGRELHEMATREKAALKGTMLSGRRARLRTGRADL